jgi:hypothetical protein
MEQLQAKYRDPLGDEDAKRWCDNLDAKSIVAAAVYLRVLGSTER